MYGNADLSKIAGSRPSLYGLNVATILFEKGDLKQYCLSPKKAHKNSRKAFPAEFEEKLNLLKGSLD